MTVTVEHEGLARHLAALDLRGPVEPFLVFADWLQSQGSVWGELMEEQCRLPVPVTTGPALERHGQTVCFLVRRPAARLRWERGFITFVERVNGAQEDVFLDELQALLALPACALMRSLVFNGGLLFDEHARAMVVCAEALKRLPRLLVLRHAFSREAEAELRVALPLARLQRRLARLDDSPR